MDFFWNYTLLFPRRIFSIFVSSPTYDSLQSLGHVALRGVQGVSRNVACFPAMGVVPSAMEIIGVRYAYQPKSKQQRKGNVVPSHRIGVTKSWDSHHTGKVMFVVNCNSVQTVCY